MPNYAIYNTSNNRVKQWILSSSHDPSYPVGAGEAAIRDPDVSAVASIPLRYWKHAAGAIVEMTQGEKDTVDSEIAAALLASLRSGAVAIIDGTSPESKAIRAVLLLILDEINTLRQWLASFKTETAAATNLSNFQSRVATLPGTPDRTASQARTAIENKINAGDADA